MDGRTLSGKVESSAGGVGRNLADCLTRLGANPLLVSNAGAKEHAQALLSKMDHMDKSSIKIVEGARTATCIVILDSQGECPFLIGDMSVHDALYPQQVKDHEALISEAPLVIIDGNIPLETLDFIFDLCSQLQVPVCRKCQRTLDKNYKFF
ncbi:hypothetical protein JTE90_014586 [Oedothorax gibbosus]|uniref:Carbohydrate kinase PfkB domain-containing protein n=1 Tax=Oedothorax gibbosus TaxID=931172 RepID=A0AAV6UNB2_9ARAC|nr:hypothetical protein JTE90_014586 [Oedothorax gibbosus]